MPRGDAQVIEILNEILTAELTAINQYFVHAKMCQNWGFERLAKKALSVGELADGLPVSRPAVSQHLKVLKNAGLVLDERDGTRRVYSVRQGPIREADAWFEAFRSMWDQPLAALETEIARGKRKRRTAQRGSR